MVVLAAGCGRVAFDNPRWRANGGGWPDEPYTLQTLPTLHTTSQYIAVFAQNISLRLDHVVVIVVRGLDVGTDPVQAERHLTRGKCLVVDPPDREVGIASTSARAVGKGGARLADEDVTAAVNSRE